MPTYRVTREGTAIVTESSSTAGVARRVAERRVEGALARLVEDRGAATSATAGVTDVSVHEFPVGPFEPYRIAVAFSVALPVDAADEAAAVDALDDALAGVLADVGLDADEWEWDPAGEASVEAT